MSDQTEEQPDEIESGNGKVNVTFLKYITNSTALSVFLVTSY